MAKKVQKSQIEEIVEQLLEKGRKTGVLTQSEISDALHEQAEITAEQLDDIYTTLGKLNIEVVADIDAEDVDEIQSCQKKTLKRLLVRRISPLT